MKKHNPTSTNLHRASPGKALYAAIIGATMAAMLCQPVFATTIWEKANEIMKDVYNQILLISTIAAIVTASVVSTVLVLAITGWVHQIYGHTIRHEQSYKKEGEQD